MGARHANHFLHRTPRAELVAAFTPDPKELAWAQANLEPWGVKIYSDYDEMLNHKGLEAVCVATATTVHAEQTIKAIEAGKHVLCEKPLSTELSIVCLSTSLRVLVSIR
jgi:myo-inositol 2-dehydrogenase/D-chiro-inositol 1-dehydrogenase